MITFIIVGMGIIFMIALIVLGLVLAPSVLIGFLLVGPFILLDIFAMKALFGKKKKGGDTE